MADPTQKIKLIPEDELTVYNTAVPNRRNRRMQWFLLAVMLVTGLSLLITVGMLLSSPPNPIEPTATLVAQILDDPTSPPNTPIILSSPTITPTTEESTATPQIVDRVVSLTIADGAESQQIKTDADSVEDALIDAGILIYAADVVQPGLDQSLSSDMTISIERAKPITIEIDGQVVALRVQADTVADALTEADVALYDLDYVVPNAETALETNMAIRIVRVMEIVETSQETVPYETIYQENPAYELDQYVPVQAGQNGVLEAQIRVRYEDGVEVDRMIEETVTVSPVQNEVIEYGTQIVIRTVDTPEGPREYWRKLTGMWTTSYNPASVGGDNITAIGMELRKGIIAADPIIIPYRTALFVPGYGLGIMADTGGPRRSRYWLDLGYTDADFEPWSRVTEVYLLTPVPDEINYLLPGFVPD